uniref:Uncharacterized protein n=2 Tax=Caenorhabditis japonica TaxID=281687 RepID=A0A8R1DWU5_CAEJA
MSSHSNKKLEPEERVYEITAIAFASVMILISTLVIIANFRLSHRMSSRRKHPAVKKLRKILVKGRTAVKSGLLSATETVILALEAGMTLEDVRLEYVNSTGTRKEILEGVFGKSPADEKLFAQLKASGRFMDAGYANEKVFLDLWKSESYRELVATFQTSHKTILNRVHLPAQTRRVPAYRKPMEIAALPQKLV